MGDGISSKFQQLLRERKLLRARIPRGMVVKEIHAAETNLRDAHDSLDQKKFKWVMIQRYYSMFHSALLYSHGFGFPIVHLVYLSRVP